MYFQISTGSIVLNPFRLHFFFLNLESPLLTAIVIPRCSWSVSLFGWRQGRASRVEFKSTVYYFFNGSLLTSGSHFNRTNCSKFKISYPLHLHFHC